MHVFAAELAISERDLAVGEREQGLVLAQADVVARVPLGAALAHDDVAGEDGFPTELLHAEALAFAVAAVAGRAACFLMCHFELLLLRRFLGRGLSRCSIFCRPGFRGRLVSFLALLRLGWSIGALGRRVGLRLVVRRRVFRFGGVDLSGAARTLGRGCLGHWASLRLARFRRGFGRLGIRLRCGLLRLLVIADGDDLQDGVLLAVALLAAVVVAAALLEDGNLLALGLGDDLGRDGEAIGLLEVAAVAGEQDVAKRDLVAGAAIELLDDDLVSGVHAILLPTRADDCEHGFSSSENS